ncbi:MAG TPA: hypothetical protein PLC54_08995, partial [Spirochaetales bacterium]|nr:hypothetical protein [Spirochaetales bacterium]
KISKTLARQAAHELAFFCAPLQGTMTVTGSGTRVSPVAADLRARRKKRRITSSCIVPMARQADIISAEEGMGMIIGRLTWFFR